MLTEEKINANYLNFIKYLEKYNCYSEEMINELGEKIKNAPYTTKTEFGGAEDGGMINTVLTILCKNAFNVNQALNDTLKVNPNMLMRVLLLMNIAKAEMFVDADDWHQKHGMPYDFANLKTKMKLGVRSLYLCNKYGIQLEEEEFEAFLTADSPEPNGICFQSPLFTIVKAANEFTLVELRQKYLSTIKKQNVEI